MALTTKMSVLTFQFPPIKEKNIKLKMVFWVELKGLKYFYFCKNFEYFEFEIHI